MLFGLPVLPLAAAGLAATLVAAPAGWIARGLVADLIERPAIERAARELCVAEVEAAAAEAERATLARHLRIVEALQQDADRRRLEDEGARWHVGLVAQQVRDAFRNRGLDAEAIGILCYDQWPDQYGENEAGDTVLVVPAGSRWGIRYDEAQALEAAYVRRALGSLISTNFAPEPLM